MWALSTQCFVDPTDRLAPKGKAEELQIVGHQLELAAQKQYDSDLVDQWPDWLASDRMLSRSPQIRTWTFTT